MLQIDIPDMPFWDEAKEEFVTLGKKEVLLEHSLYAISLWESKFHKPFMTSEKNNSELCYYIQCMGVDNILGEELAIQIIYNDESLKKLQEYIADPMTATTVKKRPHKPSNEIVTSELIYYWMTQCQIPFECDRWNINRLLKLIEVCGAKSEPPKKMSKSDLYKQHSSLNKARRHKKP